MPGYLDFMSSAQTVISSDPEILVVMFVHADFCSVSTSAFMHVDLQLLRPHITTVSTKL